MTDLPIIKGYERWLKRNHNWFIPALENLRTLSMCYAPYSSDYNKNEEFYVGFEAVADVVGVYHDSILGKHNSNELKCGPDNALVSCSKKALSIIEKVQLFVEIITARRTKNKWNAIVLIEATKVVLRLFLLFNNGGRRLRNYTAEEIRDMNERSKCLEMAKKNFPELNSKDKVSTDENFSDLILLYATHGRGINPHGDFRPRKVIGQESPEPVETVSEIFHILRPLVYSSLRRTTHSNDFTPWVASLVTDLVSIIMGKLTVSKKPDIQSSSRTLLLLLYLFRAPFYQKYSKDKLAFLVTLVKRIPLLGSVLLGPILEITLDLLERRYFATSSS
mmetsp:Transcript_10958/g.15232  ORF Transcript_10958/g.15232 Transcript_10958/m.15232 type:complete len:334 (+) Transcript_10958:89-1090(+)|eukprot:CAMPEP_0184481130 /NCGR_PEP_ID=MMETSP0113_2-20130426/2668_1 /TAXON_ID=91329 /ORGANISM="Norrisiella sphaerica, Strain BC52" /LENGTH=333 /DNA_ID=CAMNT_0026860059 /DNA_START=69 /DNA_END=1070 /DNA_ORIENTATION=-